MQCRYSFHIAPVVLPIQEKAEAVAFSGRPTLQPDETRVTRRGIDDGMFLQGDARSRIHFLQMVAALFSAAHPPKMMEESDGFGISVGLYRKPNLPPAMREEPCLGLAHEFPTSPLAPALWPYSDSLEFPSAPIRHGEADDLGTQQRDPSGVISAEVFYPSYQTQVFGPGRADPEQSRNVIHSNLSEGEHFKASVRKLKRTVLVVANGWWLMFEGRGAGARRAPC